MMTLFLTAVAHAEEAAPGFTLTEIWEHTGGIARGVIVTLTLMVVAVIFIAFERLLAFRSATNQSRELAARIVPFLKANDTDKALAATKDEAFKASYFGAVVGAGLAEVAGRKDDHGLENAHRAVGKVAMQQTAKLRAWMPVLATVGSTAPFVGLFGTTVGVINAFQGMATAGAGLAGISAGISEALITTAYGIAVAVVGVWFFNYFNTRIDKVSEELASIEADFMDWAHKLVQGGGSTSTGA